jgi:predicted RNA-binding Zn ribbon-like protein
MDVSALPLVGGHPALDLVNSVERGASALDGDPRDYLAEPSALLIWARRAGLADDAEIQAVAAEWDRDPGFAQAALAAAREVRESLHLALLAAADLAPVDAPVDGAAARAAFDRLHGRWLAAVGRSQFAPDPEGVSAARLVVGIAPGWLVPDRAAEAAVDLLRASDIGRLRRCPTDEGGCGWVFLDQSRNGSRRWCRMADCGTAVKSRRLTERRRAARLATGK